jgi:hypothetical protein
MASDDALRSLLYGSQGVIDGIGIQYLYTQAGTDLNDSAVIDAYKAANIANSRNLHDVLPSLTGQRAAALRQILIQHLQLIAQNEETESDPLVDLTLKLLRTIKTQVQPRSFPQTGQSLYGTFEDYWDHGGGLVVFGYPKTEADVIPNIDTGRSYLTQWFERNRMEQHLEFAGSPYFVELGQLGKERMLQLNMNPAAVPREPGPQDGCHWFEATGHNVCNQDGEKGFKSYWEQNGVKDPLLPNPYVQSLALFGLPLTDAHMETNSSCVSVLTQWFERARFEWLPNNQDPYKVELGLLGNEIHENLPPCHQ